MELHVDIGEDGPAVVVDDLGVKELRAMLRAAKAGEPIRLSTTAPQLRLLSRRAAAVAAALQGIPTGPEPSAHEHPFARYWPPVHVAIELGVPEDLVLDPKLKPRAKLLYFLLFRYMPMAPRMPRWRGRLGFLAQLLPAHKSTVQADLEAMEERGWITIHCRGDAPGRIGDWDIELHLQRRDGPPAVIETTATEPETLR